MPTFLERYQSFVRATNVRILVTAFFLALACNLLFFTESGQRIQASIMEIAPQNQADISLQAQKEVVQIVAGKHFKNAQSITLTLSFDPSVIQIVKYEAPEAVELLELNDTTPRLLTLAYPAEYPIQVGDILASIHIQRLATDTAAVINLSDTSLTSQGQHFELTNQGTGEF